MTEANELIQKAPNRSAEKSMEELRNNSHVFKGLKVKDGRRRVHSINSTDSIDSDISDSTMNGMADFKFTYEEEADPETFFIPYLWSVIVCTVASSLVEWDKRNIKVFAITHHARGAKEDDAPLNDNNNFCEDVDSVV